MATQGLISILADDGTVIQKIVAGCNGYRAKDAARAIVKQKAETLEEVYEAASALIGCQECLVVMDGERARFRGDDDLDSRYRKTFGDAKFNPRWAHGTAEYTIFVHKGDVGEYVPSEEPETTLTNV